MEITEFIKGVKLVIKKLDLPIDLKNVTVIEITQSGKLYDFRGEYLGTLKPDYSTLECRFGSFTIQVSDGDRWELICNEKVVIESSSRGVDHFSKLLMKKKKAIKELIQ